MLRYILIYGQIKTRFTLEIYATYTCVCVWGVSLPANVY